jgi:hypothetical protein
MVSGQKRLLGSHFPAKTHTMNLHHISGAFTPKMVALLSTLKARVIEISDWP